MKSNYYLITFLVLIVACNTTVDPLNSDENLMVGKWKLTKAKISDGGPHYWIDIENGEEIDFFENGIFSSTKFIDCTNGNFMVLENELLLEYNCPGFNTDSENEDGFITYNLELFTNYFILTPTSGPICVEGCSYKYQKKD